MSGLPAAPAVVARRPGAQVLDVVLERITYANEESGYTIARVATDRSGPDLVTVVGALRCSGDAAAERWSLLPARSVGGHRWSGCRSCD